MTIYVVAPWRHESWPHYVASTKGGALAYVKARVGGLWAIMSWEVDHPHGVGGSLCPVYDTKGNEIADPDDWEEQP